MANAIGPIAQESSAASPLLYTEWISLTATFNNNSTTKITDIGDASFVFLFFNGGGHLVQIDGGTSYGQGTSQGLTYTCASTTNSGIVTLKMQSGISYTIFNYGEIFIQNNGLYSKDTQGYRLTNESCTIVTFR